MRLSLLDYKLIKIFYNQEDWKTQLYYIDDFKDIGVDYHTLRYHLNNLEKAGYILKHDTYPTYYEPIRNAEHRKKMEKIYTQALKALLK